MNFQEWKSSTLTNSKFHMITCCKLSRQAKYVTMLQVFHSAMHSFFDPNCVWEVNSILPWLCQWKWDKIFRVFCRKPVQRSRPTPMNVSWHYVIQCLTGNFQDKWRSSTWRNWFFLPNFHILFRNLKLTTVCCGSKLGNKRTLRCGTRLFLAMRGKPVQMSCSALVIFSVFHPEPWTRGVSDFLRTVSTCASVLQQKMSTSCSIQSTFFSLHDPSSTKVKFTTLRRLKCLCGPMTSGPLRNSLS